jgi:DNA-damage-inducible protein J
MTSAVTMFVKQAIREGGIPFAITTRTDPLDPLYSESNMVHLRRGIAALDAGRGVEHDIVEVDAE